MSIKITVLSGISSLNIGNIILSGTTTRAVQATRLLCENVIKNIQYPLPSGIEVVLLPFRITEIDGQSVATPDGIAHYESKKVYLSAFADNEFNHPAQMWMQRAWEKTLAHEIGHLVHYAHLPAPKYGAPVGLWNTFKGVHGITHVNTDYHTSLAEAFAESWRLIFVPLTQHTEHRHKSNWQTPGLKEWMLSLTGEMCLHVGTGVKHTKLYYNGQVVNMDVAPEIINGRTMVPLRFVGETLGNMVGKKVTVGWSDPSTARIKV